MSDFADTKIIIWDMDQTLYPYWADFADYCHEATAHCAAVENDIPISKAEADHLSRLSYKKRGVTTRLFKEQFGLDEIKLFRDHHQRMIDRLIDPNWGEKIQPNPELIDLMDKAKKEGIRQVILTNGAQCWAQHIAELLGIDGYMEVIMGADDFNLRQKGRDGIMPFFNVLAKAGYSDDYRHVMVVEDSLKNMVAPKEHGMKTAWVQWSHPEYHKWDKPDYVDHVFEKPNDVLKKIFKDRASPSSPSIAMSKRANRTAPKPPRP